VKLCFTLRLKSDAVLWELPKQIKDLEIISCNYISKEIIQELKESMDIVKKNQYPYFPFFKVLLNLEYQFH